SPMREASGNTASAATAGLGRADHKTQAANSDIAWRFMGPVCGPVKRTSTLLRHVLKLGSSRTWPRFMLNNLLRQPNFAALVTLVWLLVALGLLLQFWTQTAETLLDTDDAM